MAINSEDAQKAAQQHAPAGESHGMAGWRDRLFVRMAANAQDATTYYQVPIAQTMKVGLQIGICGVP